MIVECPKCGSRYRVGEERKSEKDVQVRCSACKTVFKITNPEPKGGDAAGQPGTPSGQECILVCDDALFFRTMLEEMLTEAALAVLAQPGPAGTVDELLGRFRGRMDHRPEEAVQGDLSS